MVEQTAKGFGAMIDFQSIPNKQHVESGVVQADLWPELGENFVLNQFYRQYVSAEGWIGDGYLALWTREEVRNFRGPNLEAYPGKYHFFASDGGGSQFGFLVENDKISFVSAPDIGDEEDIRILGNWSRFLKCVEAGDYI